MTTGAAGIADPCPHCGALGSRVTDSRPYDLAPEWRRRRRACASCDHRWTTVEVPAAMVRGIATMFAELDALQAAVDRFRVYARALGIPTHGAEGVDDED